MAANFTVVAQLSRKPCWSEIRADSVLENLIFSFSYTQLKPLLVAANKTAQLSYNLQMLWSRQRNSISECQTASKSQWCSQYALIHVHLQVTWKFSDFDWPNGRFIGCTFRVWGQEPSLFLYWTFSPGLCSGTALVFEQLGTFLVQLTHLFCNRIN